MLVNVRSFLKQPAALSAPGRQNGNASAFRFLLASVLRLRHRSPSALNNQGLTLIECLVAIVVISITLVAITPPIFFVTATRAQSRRGEQALQIAQSEIDRVRTAVERGDYAATDIPTTVGASINNVAAPTSVFASGLRSSKQTCNTYTGAAVPSTQLLPVDTDGDCQADFLVQTFRTTGTAGTAVAASGFRMGVRVYLNTPELQNNLGSLKVQQASLKFTSGRGSAANSPLAVLYSSIVRNDTSNSLQDYRTICSTQNSC